MPDITNKDIEDVLSKVLDKRRGEDIQHKSHHAFIETMIKREERRQEMWQKVKTNVVGLVIFGILGWVGAMVLSTFGKH